MVMKELISFDEETQQTFLKEVSGHQSTKSHMIEETHIFDGQEGQQVSLTQDTHIYQLR